MGREGRKRRGAGPDLLFPPLIGSDQPNVTGMWGRTAPVFHEVCFLSSQRPCESNGGKKITAEFLG